MIMTGGGTETGIVGIKGGAGGTGGGSSGGIQGGRCTTISLKLLSSDTPPAGNGIKMIASFDGFVLKR